MQFAMKVWQRYHKGKHSWCSATCKRKLLGIERACLHCSKNFCRYDKRGKYCSKACEAANRRLGFNEVICSHCGSAIIRRVCQDLRKDVSPTRNRYCSRTCQYEGLKGKNHPLYLGNRNADRGENWRKSRILAIKKWGRNCRFCQIETVGKNTCVDHIIPYRISKKYKELDPNHISNLWVMCRGCHTKKTMLIEPLLRDGDFDGFLEKIITYGGNVEAQQEAIEAAKYYGGIKLA